MIIVYFVYFRTVFLDQEWFALENASTLVVGWEGGPCRQPTRHENRGVSHSQQQSRASGIEIAARAATGKAPATLFNKVIEEENMSTYRSEMPTRRGRLDSKKGKVEEQPQTTLLTGNEAQDLIKKTVLHLQRAIVSCLWSL